jgi:hypothetical protein
MPAKARLSVYLDPELMKQLEDYAARRRTSLSVVAEASIASFLSPDGADKLEAALSRRLDRLSRQSERLERDLDISVEMLALFVRFWLTATPQSPDASQAAAQAKGRERFENFTQALGRRIASGRRIAREVSEDLPARDLEDGSHEA